MVGDSKDSFFCFSSVFFYAERGCMTGVWVVISLGMEGLG